MGKHYLLDLFDCDVELLNDERFLRCLLEEAAVAAGAKVLQISSYKFYPQGATVICLLSESHISIHTWPEERKAAADVYTCGDSDPQISCKMLIEKLRSENNKLSYIER